MHCIIGGKGDKIPSGIGTVGGNQCNPTMESMRWFISDGTGAVIPFSGQWIPEEQPNLLADSLLIF